MNVLSAIGLGASLMYFFDPDRGRRRRALLRDQTIGAGHRFEHFLSAACCDLQQRVQGTLWEATSLFTGNRVPDDVLVGRIRSKIGRCVAHAGCIDVKANKGHVILSGPVGAHEVGDLVSCVRGMHGVCGVENRLDVQHESAPREMQTRGWQDNWSPSTQLLVGAAGAMMLLRGMQRSFPIACVMGTVGLGLLGQALTHGNQMPGRATSEACGSHTKTRQATEPSIQT